jgi:hypothetical protein
MGGPVVRVFLSHDEPAWHEQVFLKFFKDALPVIRPMCSVSEFHICMVAIMIIGPDQKMMRT